jgi:trans-aconitate methyltransferase
MDQWEKIWSPRKVEALAGTAEKEGLESLIEADGFDSGLSRIDVRAWRSYVGQVASRLGFKDFESIFEVGCGSGAFLFTLYLSGHKVGGIDFSRSLIECASRFMPKGDFTVGDARDISIDEKSDHVVANSVFLYFPSYEYASDVLGRMCLKARKGVALLDIPDLGQKEKCDELRRRLYAPGQYEKRYAGLNHLYFKRSWFREFGVRKGLEVQIWQQDIEGYGYNEFRFNCILKHETL